MRDGILNCWIQQLDDRSRPTFLSLLPGCRDGLRAAPTKTKRSASIKGPFARRGVGGRRASHEVTASGSSARSRSAISPSPLWFFSRRTFDIGGLASYFETPLIVSLQSGAGSSVVEQLAFNQLVVGSIPTGLTILSPLLPRLCQTPRILRTCAPLRRSM